MLRAFPLGVSQPHHCCRAHRHEGPPQLNAHAIPIGMVVERLLQLLQLREIEAPQTDSAQGHPWVGAIANTSAMSFAPGGHRKREARTGKKQGIIQRRSTLSGWRNGDEEGQYSRDEGDHLGAES